MKRPPEERDRLLRLIRVTLGAGVLIVALGTLAVVADVFEPSREERASDWVEHEYDSDVGPCSGLSDQRVVCDIERTTPSLRRRLGPLTPGTEPRVCLFVLDNASVVVRGWASGDADDPCDPVGD